MRRKKARVVWLPADIDNRLGTAPIAASNAATDSSIIIKIFTAPPLGDPVTNEEIPIVLDQGSSTLGGTTAALQDKTLADVAESGYRLRRIVGKLFFAAAQDTLSQLGDATTWIVTAGFIVRRVGANGQSVASIASGGSGLLLSTVSLDNLADPWIWRRSFVVSNIVGPTLDHATFPFVNNLQMGSALDGPHVDQKTARIVGPEERLFLSVSVSGTNGNSQTSPGAILMLGDLRVLGSLRSNVGNRRNANR